MDARVIPDVSVWRDTDPARVNAILNHSAVRPWIANGDAPIDISTAVINTNNVLLMGEHGSCMFLFMQPGIYEVHSQVLPVGRGAWFAEFSRRCVIWMFTRTPCYEILTRVPQGHPAAMAAALKQGFVLEFVRPQECVFRERLVDVSIYSLTLQRWMTMADDMLAIGRQFHEILHAAAKRYGVKAPPHEDDPNHNRYVGAAIEMALYGQVVKSVLWYNRWAVSSRHASVTLLRQRNPTIVGIDNGLFLRIANEKLEITDAME